MVAQLDDCEVYLHLPGHLRLLYFFCEIIIISIIINIFFYCYIKCDKNKDDDDDDDDDVKCSSGMKNCKISHLSKKVVLKLLCMSTPNFSTNFVILHTLLAKVVYRYSEDFFLSSVLCNYVFF